MSLFNTINFLPEVFRTSPNQAFLSATMDQLATDSYNVPLDGYIGRTFSPTYKSTDNYVPEVNNERSRYQLEPTVVVQDANKKVKFKSDYTDLLHHIKSSGGISTNHQRLFSAECYNYDGKFDYDKFVNYYKYYWMPDGPDAVDIYSNEVPYQNDYVVTRSTGTGGYLFTGTGTQPNTQLTLARGGTYTFTVNQPGFRFWIQTNPGISGTVPGLPTVTTRDIFGVTNNGIETGVIRFNVPLSTAQDFYINMPIAATVDALVTNISYTKIQNRLLSEFLAEFPTGFDGINNQLSGKSFVLINGEYDDLQWTTPAMPTEFTGTDTSDIVPGYIVPEERRVYGWRVELVATDLTNTDYVIQIHPQYTIEIREKVFVRAGLTYASSEYWVDPNYRYKDVPINTSAAEYLYFQDGTNPAYVGQIKLVNNINSTIDVDNEILGKSSWCSPNGVNLTNGLKLSFDSNVIPAAYANKEFYVEGVGTSINLVPVDQLAVPESYGENIDVSPDYITINRGSQDRNGWSRYNRWFHVDVLTATAGYNSADVNYGPNIPARRPIIEFNSGLQLFNYGSRSIDNVDIVIFEPTDAFNEVEGQATASVDGVAVQQNDYIVFADDYDTNVKNKIWEVIIEIINGSNYITLIDTGLTVTNGSNVLALRGGNQGKSFYYDGTNWHESQAKTQINQQPNFDLVDANGYSFADNTVYPGSTFVGTCAFQYKEGTGTNDSILGFPLSYQTFNNIGDIVFENCYDKDTFTYVDDLTTVTKKHSQGYFAVNNGTTVTKETNWVTSVEDTKQYQLFTKFYDGRTVAINGVDRAFVQVDVLPNTEEGLIPYTKVFLNNRLLTAGVDYNIVAYGVYHLVEMTSLPSVGDKIDVQIFSDTISKIGYYEIPKNLDSNPLNENFPTITLGQLRTHYNKLIENYAGVGKTQDTYLKAQIGTITHHSSPLVYAATFLNDPVVNFTTGINLARKEYTRFKNKFLSLCASLTTLNYNNPASGVDTILQSINSVKNNSFPWFYSDMVPQGGNYTTLTYTVLNARQANYEINSIFDVTQLSNRAVLIYVNGTQLTLDADYTFSTIVPAVTITKTLVVGDIITIRDYFNTDGNYIPETPSKLGLYPKFEPEIYLDDTYQTPVSMIRGHDGSITPAFGDFRDQYLLELEKRIYNNIKANYLTNELNRFDIIPGRFRQSDYSLEEFNQLLTQNFLQWVGSNGVDYTTNSWYNASNPWTWNYYGLPDTVNRSSLQGSWRAVFKYWYDTDRPNLAPWEMLGFSSIPSWWLDRYGESPYTKGNLTLWDDLEAGYIWNNGDPYTDLRFARPGLSTFIPVDFSGNLLSPNLIPLSTLSTSKYVNGSFAVGQQGPVETAWRNSSDYTFAVQVAFALAKPAEYFATQIDTSLVYRNPITNQFSTADNIKITPSILKVNGDTTLGTIKRTSGYINWIGDGIKNLGINPAITLQDYFNNMTVQLSYKVAGFTDKNLLTVSAEQTTPSSTNASVIIPDENYRIYLSKSVPVSTATYSAVIVEKVTGGYSVTGYDLSNPFFTIIPSIASSNSTVISASGVGAKVYNDSTGTSTKIPYGTEFTTLQQVVDFLVSYQRYLTARGFIFTEFSRDLQKQKDFILSAEEFLYWSQQGWTNGTILVLNPITNKLIFSSYFTVVDEITNAPTSSRVLDQNFVPIKSTSLTLLRDSVFTKEQAEPVNVMTMEVINGSYVSLAKLNLVQYEHTLIFDNVDDFGDIIYVPSQGTRQYRLKLSGEKTGGWNGMLFAPGYVYSDPKILTWETNYDYKTGDIITFSSNYYTATKNIPASSKFDATQWKQISSDDIRTGLLPSFGHNAQKFANYYDVDNPPPEEDLQLFSAGLIGFRQKPYLTDLGISIPNQTKFYQGYIKQKGSRNSINALTKANFENVQGTVTTYEEWAFLIGKYGDFSRNQYNEFILDQSIFNTNPVAFTYASEYSTTHSDIIDLSSANIYNSSNLSSTTTSIYNNRVDSTYITDLPTAGFVHLDDVESTLFNIANATPADVLEVGSGHKIWVAKDSQENWNVLRVTETKLIATKINYMLDSYAQLFFNGNHSFEVGDSMVLTNFNTIYGNYNGVYTVEAVPNSSSITITVSPTAGNNLLYLVQNSPLTAAGTVYALESMKIDSITDITNITPLNGWRDYDRVWVDSATENGWGVYTYSRPWDANTVSEITPVSLSSNERFGSAIRISSNTEYVYTGSPGEGRVYANIINSSYANIIVSNANSSFGSAIESQGNLLVVGAPTDGNVHVYLHSTSANTITKLQTIHSSNVSGRFGTSIAMSTDQRWLYIGEPGSDVVQAYWTANIGANAYYDRVTAFGTGTGNVGYSVKTNGSTIFVGAPNATNEEVNNGNVYVFTRTSNAFALSNTLSSNWKNENANFGASLAVDGTGGNLFVGIPGSTQSGIYNGRVERYIKDGSNYVFNEYIEHPNEEIGNFGSSISVSSDAVALVVSSQGSSGREETTFDDNATVIDGQSTIFIDLIFNSGAVYLFEPLIDRTDAGTLGEYIYVQELETQINTGDQYGTAIDVTRSKIAIGAPGTNSNAGAGYLLNNPNEDTVWMLTREQQPQVDINSINRTFLYNKTNDNILTSIDYIDPKKGKVLNSVGKDIDYYRIGDPAVYNAGTGVLNPGFHWGPNQVGKIWWDLDSVRFIEYEQDTLSYRLNNWGKMFDGSTVNVYQWVESSVLPSQYRIYGGRGAPVFDNDSAYCTYGWVDQRGTVHLKYYFWVAGLDEIAKNKSNSVISITAGIENPQSQGVTYATVLRNDTLALYNINSLLTGTNSVLHVEKRTIDAGLIHSEYALIQEGNPTSKIPGILLNKFVDSIAGQDAAGNVVPDPTLTPAQAYGISVRPRQGMFIDKSLALLNYVGVVNEKLISYPVVERKVLTTLNSSETIPPVNSGAYDLIVADSDELTYVDTNMISDGYRVLVSSVRTQSGKWVIYEWDGNVWNVAIREDESDWIQNYKTNLYWDFVDYYDPLFDSTTTVDYTVDTILDFGKLTLVPNTYVKILDAGSGNFAIYYIDSSLNKTLVGIENGTIQISTGVIPPKELRQILIAIQTEVLIDDLAAEFNQVFFLLVKYALTEQKNLDWVFKTSFLSATQYIRKLQQFPSYIPDNQNYYLDYINEVKPYRTILREFVVDYQGDDKFDGDVTDFDLQPYWDANLKVYRSPSGEQRYDSSLVTSGVYSQWNNKHTYSVVDVVVDVPGTGFNSPPQIIITGGGGTGATAVSAIDGNSGVLSITITNAGSGYTSTPLVTINGTGSGTVAYPILRNVWTPNFVNSGDGYTGHNIVRSIKTTMKFDRINYAPANTFVMWDEVSSGDVIPVDTILVLGTSLYKLTDEYTVDPTLEFPLANVTVIATSSFDNANDRIVSSKGNINLSKTQYGLEYPGVKVDGNTYVGEYIDSTISSRYTDSIGVAPSDIIVDGGRYYDTYNSHAPEEMVPGIIFDSLNLQVFEANLAYRVFKNMQDVENYTRVSSAGSTTLTANLAITDTLIYVTDVSTLPPPNPEGGIPGIVFINGEKITYYEYNLDNNTLGRIRRAVDGTGGAALHTVGSRVVDASLQQKIPLTTFTEANIGLAPVTYPAVDSATLKLVLNTNITANVGDYITEYFVGGTVAANLLVIERTVNSNTVPVVTLTGTISLLTGNTVQLNGTHVAGNVVSGNPLGMVSSGGEVTLAANTVVTTGTIWYALGSGTPTNGLGLENSNTIQSNFLLDQPGYTP